MRTLSKSMKIAILGFVVFVATAITVRISIQQNAISEGRTLFTAQCVRCHGDQGKGEGGMLGTALNNQQFLNNLSDQDLFNHTKFGRPGTTMPAYQVSLTDEQIENLVMYMRTWQQQQINFKVPSAITGDKKQGAELFKVYCASCHGSDGKGKPGMGTALNNPNYLKYMTDKQIWIDTAYGRGETAMGPSLQGLTGVRQLTEQQISDIVAYIRSFQE